MKPELNDKGRERLAHDDDWGGVLRGLIPADVILQANTASAEVRRPTPEERRLFAASRTRRKRVGR